MRNICPSRHSFRLSSCALLGARTSVHFAPPVRYLAITALDNWKRYNEAGVFYMQRDELDKAEHMFRTCLALEENEDSALDTKRTPYLTISLANLGIVLRKRQNFDEAKRILEEAARHLARFPDAVQPQQMIAIRTELAHCARQQLDWLAAAESFEAILGVLGSARSASSSSFASPPAAPSSTPVSSTPSFVSSSSSSQKPLSPVDVKRATVTFHLAQALHKHSQAVQEKGNTAEAKHFMETALGHYRTAVELMQNCCGESAVELAPILTSLATALVQGDQLHEAETILWRVVQIYRIHGSPELQDAMVQYASVGMLKDSTHADTRQKHLERVIRGQNPTQ